VHDVNKYVTATALRQASLAKAAAAPSDEFPQWEIATFKELGPQKPKVRRDGWWCVVRGSVLLLLLLLLLTLSPSAAAAQARSKRADEDVPLVRD
jgi:hypothetical protein